MTKAIARTAIIIALACCGQAYGQVSLTLIPSDGDVAGEPGQTVGWGFDIVNDTSYYLLIDNSYFCESGEDPVGGPDFTCAPSLGASTYTDFIATYTGLLDPGETIEDFDDVSMGVGAYTIDPAASVGSIDSGDLVIEYDEYDSSFNEVAADLELTASASVMVTPEPNTALPLAGALLIAGLVIRRRRKAA